MRFAVLMSLAVVIGFAGTAEAAGSVEAGR
jgi:hypothetical protein